MNTFAKNLSALIDSKNTTQSAVAAVSGATGGAVSSWLSGRNRPRQKYLERICEYYGVTMDDLLSEGGGLYAKVYGLADAVPGAVAASPGDSSTVNVAVLGAVHAGSRDQPWEFDGGGAKLLSELHARHPNCYALEVNGDCMDRVFTGADHIFIDPDMTPRDGSIAVALADGEAVVRRVKAGSSSYMLVAESHSEYADIILAGDDARWLGVVFWWQARGECA